MNNMHKLALVALLLVGLSACMAGSEASHHAATQGPLPVLLLGFWHGLIAPFTLLGEILAQVAPNLLPWTFHFYEKENPNVLYDVGFFFGMFSTPSLLWTGASRRRIR